MAVNIVNPKADFLRRLAALSTNTNAAKGLQEILRSNLGPRGTLKMLVGGAGQIKITKDGNVLLQEMQIQHPTASMIARAATALDEMTGDGSTSNVLLIGELMKLGERLVSEGAAHPHVLCEGMDLARKELLRWLDEDGPGNRHVKVPVVVGGLGSQPSRELLMNVARTALRTKLHPKIADHLTPLVVDAVLLVRRQHSGDGREEEEEGHKREAPLAGEKNRATAAGGGGGGGDAVVEATEDAIDLFMVEILHMLHRINTDSRLVRGLVLDHGTRHPDMPEKLSNCYILTLNVSLEYEKSEVNSGFFYSNVDQREKLVVAERKFTDDKVRKIVALKRQMCDKGGSGRAEPSGASSKQPEAPYGFVVLNQKGIDPPSLDMLAKEGIIALRRVKRRNMERLTLCCGGEAVNCVDNLKPQDLGYADEVYQQTLGEDKFTFVEGVKHPKACTLLLKGPNEHTIAQMKDAIRDGLRAVKNVLIDGYVVPGGGAFEVAAYERLQAFKKQVTGKRKLGVDIVADGLLVIPKALAENSGFDSQDCLLKLLEEYEKVVDAKQDPVAIGLDVYTGEPMSPEAEGVWDNYRVKRHMLSIAPTLAQNLLQVDEVMRAGKAMGGGAAGGPGGP